jgi:hypothetical protein
MTPTPPIPTSIWQRILAFLRAGHTGQIVLEVHRGKVSKASLNEHIRENEKPEASRPSGKTLN